jgi:isopentenyl phosphate kinase
MGGVEGVLTGPPTGENDESKLIENLHKQDAFRGEHLEQLDVTGGIGLKVERGFQTAAHGITVQLVSGEIDGRVRDACLGVDVRCTTLKP